MLLSIIHEQHIRLAFDGNDGLQIEGAPFAALHMLATSLALCTGTVMHDYATTAQFRLDRFAIDVQWNVAGRPRRVDQLRMRLLVGPDVPPSRQQALLRAVESQCPVHNTLTRGAAVDTTLEVIGAQQA